MYVLTQSKNIPVKSPNSSAYHLVSQECSHQKKNCILTYRHLRCRIQAMCSPGKQRGASKNRRCSLQFCSSPYKSGVSLHDSYPQRFAASFTSKIVRGTRTVDSNEKNTPHIKSHDVSNGFFLVKLTEFPFPVINSSYSKNVLTVVDFCIIWKFH